MFVLLVRECPLSPDADIHRHASSAIQPRSVCDKQYFALPSQRSDRWLEHLDHLAKLHLQRRRAVITFQNVQVRGGEHTPHGRVVVVGGLGHQRVRCFVNLLAATPMDTRIGSVFPQCRTAAEVMAVVRMHAVRFGQEQPVAEQNSYDDHHSRTITTPTCLASPQPPTDVVLKRHREPAPVLYNLQ
jgi:hypothetical protein